jgi:hypothetical protein
MIHNMLPVVHEGEFVFVFITHHEDDPNASCHQLLCIYRMIEAGFESQVLSPSLALIGGYTLAASVLALCYRLMVTL